MSASFFTLDELGLTAASQLPPDTLREDVEVLEVNDLATLSELVSLWPNLLRATPRPRFSQTWEWLELYVRQFGERERLRAFCVDRQGEMVGLTVLMETRSHGQSVLTLPRVGWEVACPLGTDTVLQWSAVGTYLRERMSSCDCLDLCGLHDPHGEIEAALSAAGWPLETRSWPDSYSVRLSRDPADLQERFSVSSRLRSRFDGLERQASSLGPLRFVRFRPQATEDAIPHLPDEVYEHCLLVALNDEQQIAAELSWCHAPDQHRFLRDLFFWASRHSAADVCLLFAGSRPIAFRFHTLCHGHLQTIWTGTDSEFRDLPAAAVLLDDSLADGLCRGDLELELGPADLTFVQHLNANITKRRRLMSGLSPSTLGASSYQERGGHDS